MAFKEIWSRQRTVLLLLGYFLVLKMPLTLARYLHGDTGMDGGYYLDLAQNLSRSAGFVTDVSPFHQGLPALPFPSPVYPLWALVLGFLGKILPVGFVAFWLPHLLYFVILVLAWKLGQALFPNLRYVWRNWDLTPGHLLLILFATHFGFCLATSAPYTEGLSYALLFCALLRCGDIFRNFGAKGGLELAFWSALLFLCRAQFLLFFLAAVLFSAILILAEVDTRGRRRAALGTFVLIAAFCVFIAPEILFISSLTDGPAFQQYLRFDQFQATHVLPRIQTTMTYSSIWEGILGRLGGFRVAFGFGGDSYSRNFRGFPFLFLFCLPFMIRFAWIRRREWLKDRRLAFFVVFALAGFFSLHWAQLTPEWGNWRFGGRQGLTAVFLFFLGATYFFTLLDSRKFKNPYVGYAFRGVMGLLIYVSLIVTYNVSMDVAKGLDKAGSYADRNRKFIDWLNLESESKRLTVCVPLNMGKLYAPHTPNVGYQEFDRHLEFEEMDSAYRALGCRFLLAKEQARFRKDPRFARQYRSIGIPAKWIYVRTEE